MNLLFYFFDFIFIINISYILNNNIKFNNKNKKILTNQILLEKKWDVINFKISENISSNCTNCIPSIIKYYQNRLFVSFPRYNKENNITFAYYDDNKNLFVPYPNLNSNILKDSNNIYNEEVNLISVNGFEIDEENSILYLLDSGRIENNKSINIDETSLYIFNLKDETAKVQKRIKLKNYINYKTSNLINLAVDITKKIAYIIDSGSPFLDINITHNLYEFHPALIIVYFNDFENIEIYRILENRKEFYPDFTYWLKINENKLYNNYPYYFGINGITLDCDFKTLYFSSISSRKIFSMLTKNIEKYIKYNIIRKEEGNFYDLEIYENYKEESSDGILVSRSKKLYYTGLESGSIYIAEKLDVDLIRFTTKKIVQIKGNDTIIWPSSIIFKDTSVFFLTNQKNIYIQNNYTNNITNNNDVEYIFKLLRYDLGEKDYSYIKKCSSDEKTFKTKLIVWILFSIIIMIVLSFVFIGSGKQDDTYDKKNLKLISKKKNK